jgi:hypothetical protein
LATKILGAIAQPFFFLELKKIYFILIKRCIFCILLLLWSITIQIENQCHV